MTYSLDQLFSEARTALRHEQELEQAARKTKRVKEAPTPPAVASELFSNPENWIAGEAVSLHAEGSGSFLGVFVEWRHRSVAGARKLVRATTARVPTRTETTRWVERVVQTPLRSPEIPLSGARLAEDLVLEGSGQSARLVSLDIIHQRGQVLTAKLLDQTQFVAEGCILDFPPGLNIYLALDRWSKARIYQQIKPHD